MKSTKLFLAGTMLAIGLFSCSKDDDTSSNSGTTSATLQGVITTNTHLTADREWTLEGTVVVEDGATLTIDAGTTVYAGSEETVLVINRGGKINAEGTADKPVVFTSKAKKMGSWGGIMLIGKATTNRTAAVKTEGFVQYDYGTDKIDNDNSGVLKYVRVEYAGRAYATDKEINALSFYAVGNGTTISNVQTYYSNDDAFEFFGGTVNADHLVAVGTVDDDLDFDFGYSGKIEYVLAVRDPLYADAKDASNGIESDNDGDGSSSAPLTKPTLKHITLIGPNATGGTVAANHGYAARLRRASTFDIQDAIFVGHQKGGLLIESYETGKSIVDVASVITDGFVASIMSGTSNVAPMKASTTTTTSNPTKTAALAFSESSKTIEGVLMGVTVVDPSTILTSVIDFTQTSWNFGSMMSSSYNTKGAFATSGFVTSLPSWIKVKRDITAN